MSFFDLHFIQYIHSQHNTTFPPSLSYIYDTQEKHKPTRNYNTSLPTVEGGIVDAKQFRVTKYEHAYELEDRDKDNSIAVVGLGLELLTLEASISM